MSGTVTPGGTHRWPANTELLGIPGTPSVLTLTVKDPSGNVVAGFPIALGGLQTSGTGQYYYDWLVSVAAVTGTYTAVWAGTLNGLPIGPQTDTVAVYVPSVGTAGHAYCTLAEWRQREAGDAPIISGSYDQTLISAIAEVSSLIDEEVRLVRGQAQGWSFLPPSLYGSQQVSISGSPASGTFTLTSGTLTTVAIPPTATSATVQAALDTILGSGNSVVAGSAGGPWTITFASTLPGPQPVLTAASSFPAPIHAVVQELVTGSGATVTRRYAGTQGGASLILIDDAVAVSGVRILTSSGALSQTFVLGTDYLPYPLNASPITGLRLLHGGWWPGYPGGVSVDLTPGYALTLPANVRLAALQEVTRAWRGAQVGENDTLGTTPFGSVVVSKALLQSTMRMIERYRFGAGFLRVPS